MTGSSSLITQSKQCPIHMSRSERALLTGYPIALSFVIAGLFVLLAFCLVFFHIDLLAAHLEDGALVLFSKHNDMRRFDSIFFYHV